jgi:hypothetical protein
MPSTGMPNWKRYGANRDGAIPGVNAGRLVHQVGPHEAARRRE